MTILRFIEVAKIDVKVGGVVMVAGFSESIGYQEIDNFFQTPLDYQKVKNSAQQFVAINSDNDHYVPLAQAEILRDKLGAELVVLKSAGHLNDKAGFYQLPILLEKLQLMMAI